MGVENHHYLGFMLIRGTTTGLMRGLEKNTDELSDSV